MGWIPTRSQHSLLAFSCLCMDAALIGRKQLEQQEGYLGSWSRPNMLVVAPGILLFHSQHGGNAKASPWLA